VDESSVRELVRFISVATWTAGEGDLSGEALGIEVRHVRAAPFALTHNAISPYTSHPTKGILIILVYPQPWKMPLKGLFDVLWPYTGR